MTQGIRTYDVWWHTAFKQLLWHKTSELTRHHLLMYRDTRHLNIQCMVTYCLQTSTYGIWTYEASIEVLWHTASAHTMYGDILPSNIHIRHLNLRGIYWGIVTHGIRTYEAFERTRHSNVRDIRTYEAFKRTRHSNVRGIQIYDLLQHEAFKRVNWLGHLCDMAHWMTHARTTATWRICLRVDFAKDFFAIWWRKHNAQLS